MPYPDGARLDLPGGPHAATAPAAPATSSNPAARLMGAVRDYLQATDPRIPPDAGDIEEAREEMRLALTAAEVAGIDGLQSLADLRQRMAREATRGRMAADAELEAVQEQLHEARKALERR